MLWKTPGLSKALSASWKGSYKVVSRIGDVTYTVKNVVLHYTSFGVPTTLSVLHSMRCIDTPPN